MDTDCPNVYQELNNMQLKIASLFKDLIKERNNYKETVENLNLSIKCLSNECENFQKENKELKLINDEMKNLIQHSIRIFNSMDISSLNLRKEHTIELENLKKYFINTYRKVEHSELSNTNVNQTGKPIELNVKRYQMNNEDIQKECELIKDLNLTTQFFQDNDVECITNENCVGSTNSKTVLKNLCERQPGDENITKPQSPLLLNETETFITKHESALNRSPVFKDVGIRKQDCLNEESDCGSSKSSPAKLLNEKFLEKPKSFYISPQKKQIPINWSPGKSPSTPKRQRKKLKMTSPKTSPKAQIKKSNSMEAEVSISGVRKLTQTLLNVECFKKSLPESWKNRENRENEHFESKTAAIKEEVKDTIDEEDDFIIESPKKSDQFLEDIKNKMKSGNEMNGIHLITPPETSDVDLDETYISASVVKRSETTKKHLLEKTIEDQTPLKRPTREKSPEYDSSPFAYKREPVRKKAERMKLPGHACLECNKYYENALGDVDSKELKMILNKCSRHRDKYSPTHYETPPGYWKPYLTCSVIISPEKDNSK